MHRICQKKLTKVFSAQAFEFPREYGAFKVDQIDHACNEVRVTRESAIKREVGKRRGRESQVGNLGDSFVDIRAMR